MNGANKWMAPALVAVVILVWAGAYVVTFFDHNYSPPAGLTELMMAVAGFLLTGKYIASSSKSDSLRKKDSGNEQDKN